MLIRSLVLPRACIHVKPRFPTLARRCLLTLAIETSCDDTSVAILEKTRLCDGRTGAILHFHKKITSDNTQYRGVHPLTSLCSHQENLANLVHEATQHLPSALPPTFISVTRGPGMRSNLFTGIDTAKGLAVAWQTDLVGVHHMQAHALTPRLVAALQNVQEAQQRAEIPSATASSPPKHELEPQFPFLSVLASGGHTLLIRSESLVQHNILASTNDIAVGECLDKVARAVLPPDALRAARTTMYGALLEEFAFTDVPAHDTKKSSSEPEINTAGQGRGSLQYKLEDNTAENYRAIYKERYEHALRMEHEGIPAGNKSEWGWTFNQPFTRGAGGLKSKNMEMSFSGLMSAVERAVKFYTDPATGRLTKMARSPEDISIEERKSMAREAMRAAFGHVCSRVALALQQTDSPHPTIVLSGGVAANAFFRYILARTLCAKGFSDARLVFPPPALCTDNAAMIAWTGLEMYEAGYNDSRKIRALRKWPLDQLLSPSQDD